MKLDLPLRRFTPARIAALRFAAGLGLGCLCVSAHAAHTISSSSAKGPAGAVVAGAGLLALYGARRRRRIEELERRLRQAEEANAALREQNEFLKEAEARARVNAERFRSLTRLSADWYWEQDAQFRFTMRTTWLLGEESMPEQNYIGRCRWELPGVIRHRDWEAHRRALEAHRPFRGLEYQFSNLGKLRWVSVNGEPMFDEAGKFTGYRGTGRDITHRKTIEAALRTSEERFHKIIGSMPVGLFIKDPQNRVLLMNRECERQWGVSFADVEGTDASHVLGSDGAAHCAAAEREAFEARGLIESETVIRNVSSGEKLLVRALKKPVFDEAGQPSYLICITVDITQQKRTEEQLRLSREWLRQLARHQTSAKEDERKRIARDIHDELGQNLMALRLDVTTLIQDTAALAPTVHRHALLMMETVDRTIKSVRLIINDLRPPVLDLGLVAALEWQVDEFARRSSLACTLEIAERDRELELDDARATALFRVLQESLTNVQRHAGASSVQVRLQSEDARVVLSVSDDGKGGVMLSERGQHFGLFGMRERVRMLDGKFTIGERPEGGTTLVASLPLGGEVPRPQQL